MWRWHAAAVALSRRGLPSTDPPYRPPPPPTPPTCSLPVMGSVLGAAVARLHHNITRAEAATLKYISSEVGIFRDFPNAKTGGSFWYDIAPSIFAASLSDLFAESAALRNMTQTSIDRWVGAAQHMGWNFTHTAYDFQTRQPVNNGIWIEADAAAGVGWIAFMGSRINRGVTAARHLHCARLSIAALEDMPWNPLYEMQLPFGALAAARLNAEAGGEHNVTKLLNWCLTPDEPTGNHLPGAPAGVTRSGWGSIVGRWGDNKTVDGLIGSSTDGGGYAFFANTAWFFAALSPIARYDYRFASALGKWMSAVAVNARYFYPNFLGERQSGPVDWDKDPKSLIPYEGLRKCDFSRPAGRCLHGSTWGPYGTGQNCGDAGVRAGSGMCRPVPTIPTTFTTDRGLYGGTYVGLIGGAIYQTSVPRVLQFCLNANDRFAPASLPTALLYNSMDSAQTVNLNTSAAQRALGATAVVDIYETISDTVIVRGISLSATISVHVNASSGIVVVVMPAQSALERTSDGQVISRDPASGLAVVVRFRVPRRSRRSKTDDNAAASGLTIGIIQQGTNSSSSVAFTVSVNGTVWLEGLKPALHTDRAWSQHTLTAPKVTTGADRIGAFQASTFTVHPHDNSERDVELIIREYTTGQTVVFTVRFPGGANGTRTTNSNTACKTCTWPTQANNFTGCLGTSQGTQCTIEPASRFPSFRLNGGLLPRLGFKTWEFTFGVDHSSGHRSSTGAATEAGFGATIRQNGNTDLDPAGGAPVILFDEFDQAALTVGPLDNFMTVVGSTAHGEWATGVGGEISSLPPGFECSTLLHLSTGITDSMLGWGAALRRHHNTTRNVANDIGLSKLGYWTDNGAYFM